jgi:transposase-like protein
MAVTLENPRELRGLEILSKGKQIIRIDAGHYRVRSQNGNGVYLVVKEGKEWTCECPDHANRQVACKHIYSVFFSLSLRERVVAKVQPQIESVSPDGCVYCASPNIVKIGIRHNLNGDAQRFLCRDCNRKFVKNDGFEKIKATPRAICMALDSYFKGMSQRKIVDHLRQVEGIKVSQPGVLKWIRKYIDLMKPYVDRFTPQVGGIWHSDETMIKVRRTEPTKDGNYSWAWNLMDGETRFLLASEITKHRDIVDARKVLAKARKNSGEQSPDFIVTDKLAAYKKAIPKEYLTFAHTKGTPVTRHVRLKNIVEGTNNNVLERLHGTQKERLKVMRGLDHDASAERMMEANRIYYNFIRPHSALNGQHPQKKQESISG